MLTVHRLIHDCGVTSYYAQYGNVLLHDYYPCPLRAAAEVLRLAQSTRSTT